MNKSRALATLTGITGDPSGIYANCNWATEIIAPEPPRCVEVTNGVEAKQL